MCQLFLYVLFHNVKTLIWYRFIALRIVLYWVSLTVYSYLKHICSLLLMLTTHVIKLYNRIYFQGSLILMSVYLCMVIALLIWVILNSVIPFTFQISKIIYLSSNAIVHGSLFSKLFTVVQLELSQHALTCTIAIFTIGKKFMYLSAVRVCL